MKTLLAVTVVVLSLFQASFSPAEITQPKLMVAPAYQLALTNLVRGSVPVRSTWRLNTKAFDSEASGTNWVVYRVVSIQDLCGYKFVVSYPSPRSDLKVPRCPVIVEYPEHAPIIDAAKVLKSADIYGSLPMTAQLRVIDSILVTFKGSAGEKPEQRVMNFGFLSVGGLLESTPIQLVAVPGWLLRERQEKEVSRDVAGFAEK